MPPVISDLIGAEAHSPLAGSPLRLVDAAERALPGGGVLVAVDRAGALPPLDPARFDALVTTRADAPPPWIIVAPAQLEALLAAAIATAKQRAIATVMLARVLRLGEGLDFEAALELETLANSTLLGGAEFARWPDRGAGSDRPVARTDHGPALRRELAAQGRIAPR